MSIDSLNLIRELLECYIDEQQMKIDDLNKNKESMSAIEYNFSLAREKQSLAVGKTALEQFNGKWHR